jgi:hypothetical protein
MALKKVGLTFAERVCLSDALQRQPGDIEVARYIKEIRQRFELRRATQTLDKVNLTLRRINRVSMWDEINENFAPLLEWIAEEQDRVRRNEKMENRDEILGVLSEVEDLVGKSDLSAREFTIDSAYLRWMREVAFSNIDWSKVRIRTPAGVQERVLDVDLGRMEAFASLDEALANARPAQEEEA